MAIPPDRFADPFTDGGAFLSSEALDGERGALSLRSRCDRFPGSDFDDALRALGRLRSNGGDRRPDNGFSKGLALLLASAFSEHAALFETVFVSFFVNAVFHRATLAGKRRAEESDTDAATLQGRTVRQISRRAMIGWQRRRREARPCRQQAF
jgi:hypothetical protein